MQSLRLKTLRYSPDRKSRRRYLPAIEVLEQRCCLAMDVTQAELFLTTNGELQLVADFSQPLDLTTVQANDLKIDGATTATSFTAVDADTLRFVLPTLGVGAHGITLGTNSISSSSGSGVNLFSKNVQVVANGQFTINQTPRLQPGNAPLVGYAGSDLDRVDILWQTLPGGAGTQDSFVVQYRPVGNTNWQTATINSQVATGVENRVIHSASITGLNWNSNYEYRVRQLQGDAIVQEYAHTFRTRLAAGDTTPFSFVAYGDSASGSATGFRQVQARVNQLDPKFTVLLGDNVYNAGSHSESDSRFSPAINPEAAAWIAGHIDYLGLGNHDVGTGSGLPAEQNFSVPIPVAGVTSIAAPPASERPEHSFSWDYGDVHFVTFDTNSYTSTTRLDGLLQWVVADLKASNARWKIVYGHHPLGGVPDKPESANDNYFQQVVNRLQAAGVDLFMTGHSHTYSWTYPLTGQINGTAVFADHGDPHNFHADEGLPQLVSGVGGVDLRTGDYSQFPFVAEGFSQSTAVASRFGFSKIDVTQDQLKISYIAADDGSVIDAFTLSKENRLAETSFQQNVNNYTATTDTLLQENSPAVNNSVATSLKVDSDDPPASNRAAQTLLKFDNLFGTATGQIPPTAIIRSALLQLQVTNGSTNNMSVHRMLQNWSASDTWNTWSNGLQANGSEVAVNPDISSGQTQPGTMSFNITSSLQTWQNNPATNFGWAILPTGTDGVDFSSSEGSTPPKLIVSYLPSYLTLQVDRSSIVENNGQATATVTRNDVADISQPLTVQITSGDTSEASVPTQVIIPAGQAAATFVIQSVDDLLVDGLQTSLISVAAAGFQSDSLSMSIIDNDFLPYHNTAAGLRSDTNEDGSVNIRDILAVVFYFNYFPDGNLPWPTPPAITLSKVDVVADNRIDIRDILAVVFDFNQANPEGEVASGASVAVTTPVTSNAPSDSALLELLACDLLFGQKRKDDV